MRVKTLEYLEQKEAIINKCEVCSVAMVDENNEPYVLPFNFAYQNQTLYLHSAPEGRKIDVLKRNPDVCVSFSSDYQLYHQNERVACSYSMKYKSVLLHGKVNFIDDLDRKKEILNLIMEKYTSKSDFGYSMPALKNVTIMEIPVENLEGRTFGY